ncbi:zinc finger protein ZFP2-like isoform X2 [Plodia interpunctella]|nr:zinc finger protein ZFP2-like isoform X2 [Plodia interpunctella]
MRPIAACYICYSRLRNSLKLMHTSLLAESFLRGILEKNQINDGIIGNQKSLVSISITPIEYYNTSEEAQVKNEPKNEEVEKTVKTEETIESPKSLAVSDVEDKEFSDSEDDLPLKSIRLKQEQNARKKDDKVRNRDGKLVYKMNAREIILTKEEQIEELLARAKTENYRDSPYKCDLCYKGFVDAQAYENHKEKHDEKSGGYPCDICRMRYRSARQLRSHLATSHQRRYQCYDCPHKSHTANQAREHDKWHKGYTYECQLCGQKFRKPTSYLTHMRKSHPTEHVCEICGDSFVGRHGLLMHKSKTHRQTEQIPTDQQNSNTYCSECKIQFVTSDAWKRHIIYSFKHKSSNQDSSWCRICESRVSGAPDAHARAHARELRARARGVALGASLPCAQCGAEFANKSRLSAHTRRAHLGLKYNKNIVCELCGKHCSSNATLKYHQRTHTGEKPFPCSSCPKRFSSRSHLAIHARTHSGARPYSCNTCGKSFTQKPALNRHRRVHTGVKPYECQYCSKKFSQSNSLNIHIKSVHLKIPVVRKKTEISKAQEDLPAVF